MTRYLDVTRRLAERIAAGQLAPGEALPSLRDVADAETTTPVTVRRAYRELAEAGAIVVEPRRAARVAARGEVAARSILRGSAAFRLAGSDDPALSMLLGEMDDAVTAVQGGGGSYRGLSALWSGSADGAALHLRHRDGQYNTAFARGLLKGRSPVLVHLWTREQGLLVATGNPLGIAGVEQLAALRVVRRRVGTGTRALLDRLLIEEGVEPHAITGPEVELHLDVAIAVATGEADAGLGLRSAARALELDFVPLESEPFQIVTTEAQVGGLQPLLTALADANVSSRITALGGYSLEGSGESFALE